MRMKIRLLFHVVRSSSLSVFRHRFKTKIKPSRCDHCSEMMFNGLKCKECKFKCHRDCESKVPPSCCLPEDLLDIYYRQLTKGGSPILPARKDGKSKERIF